MLNFEDVEERDGLCSQLYTLWNASHVSCRCTFILERLAIFQNRGHSNCRAHRCPLHTPEAKRGLATSVVRASDV